MKLKKKGNKFLIISGILAIVSVVTIILNGLLGANQIAMPQIFILLLPIMVFAVPLCLVIGLVLRVIGKNKELSEKN